MTFDKEEVLKEFETKRKVRDLWNWIASNMVDPNNNKSIRDAQAFLDEFMKDMESFIISECTQSYQAGREEERKMIISWLKFPYRDGMPPMEIKGLGKSEGGGCEVCGGKLVMIRGKHPHTPDRKVCPTCATEIIEGLHDNLTQTSAAKENIDHLKETK